MKKTVGENLKMFRIKKGLSMEEAGKKIGVSAPAILKYERNKIIASLERLEEFAKIYDTTIDEILNIDASINIKYDNIFFKEKASNIKKENIKNYINNKIENYFNLLKLSGIILHNKFGVHLVNTNKEAQSLATKLRIFFQIPIEAPIHNLIYLLENHNIIILTVPKKVSEGLFDGFFEIINNIPVIIVPVAENGYEQRYLVAKYLGELLIMSNNNKEELAENFARALLMPEKSLKIEFGEKRTKIHFNEIIAYSNTYKVSYKNVVKRLLEEEIITASNAKYTNIYINKNKLHEIAFTEEPYNYEKMLYKLIAQGLIQSDSKYI